MRDYEELVKALREADSLSMCGECGYKGDKKGPLFAKAADAIEELVSKVDKFMWISLKDRRPTEEERKRGFVVYLQRRVGEKLYAGMKVEDGDHVELWGKPGNASLSHITHWALLPDMLPGGTFCESFRE